MADFEVGDRVRLDSVHPSMNPRLKSFLGREGTVTNVIAWSGKVGIEFDDPVTTQGCHWHVHPDRLTNLTRAAQDEPAPRLTR